MIVNFASRIDSAISFGVFWRSAPSTRLIIRSRNDSPGPAVIRTLIQSDSTFVPAVTAERSPPDSRMTGADSPVIADSSTEAMPSSMSPSPGISSPAVTITMSPARSCDAGTVSSDPSAFRRRATRSARVFRSASACALPRPSAIASAKFANSTVNHRPSAIAVSNATGPLLEMSAKIRTVTITDTTSTTKMTGFFISVRGFSLRKLSHSARFTIGRIEQRAGPSPPRAARPRVRGCWCFVCMLISSPQLLREALDDRSERERREERQRPDDHDDPVQQADEERLVGRERPGGHRDRFLPWTASHASASAARSGTNRTTSIKRPPAIA